MTWDEILILLIMVMGLFAIDMLIAKFNLKAGRIVAILTFFVLFPIGLVAGVAALICMNSKGKQWKSSIIAFCQNVLVHASLLGIILLYMIDTILLKIFPDTTFPVVFLSFCFSPLFIFLLAKALDYIKENVRKSKKTDAVTIIENEKEGMSPVVLEKSEETGVSDKNEAEKKLDALQKAIKATETINNKKKTVTNHSSKQSGYSTTKDDPYSAHEFLSRYDPDYQDYLQGNIRLERYRYKDLIPGSVQKKYPDEKYKVILSPGRSEIRRGEFYGREDMSSVVIPEGVTKICDGAFFNCTNLVSVVIPESVKIIEHNAFLNCENLKEVFICNLRKWCDIDFGMFANPLNYAEKLYVNGNLLTEFIVPEGTEKINPFVFEGYKSLTKLKITNGVKRIEGYAFAECTGITDIVFPDSMEYIGNAAFCKCKNLESVTFPNHRITIFEGAFDSCPKLSDEIKSVINQNTQKRDLGDYELIMTDDGYERWVHK